MNVTKTVLLDNNIPRPTATPIVTKKRGVSPTTKTKSHESKRESAQTAALRWTVNKTIDNAFSVTKEVERPRKSGKEQSESHEMKTGHFRAANRTLECPANPRNSLFRIVSSKRSPIKLPHDAELEQIVPLYSYLRFDIFGFW